MKCLGNRRSKRVKLSLKYNIGKRVREQKRRLKKEARKLGLKKQKRKDPGIPNTWPFKAEMLADLERQKAQKDEEQAQKRADIKKKAGEDRKMQEEMSKQAREEKDAERRRKRLELIEQNRRESLRKVLQKAEVLVEVLDARDPLGCRNFEIEAWAQSKGKRLIFVLAKADLVSPQQACNWLLALGRVAPALAVQVEAGGEGVAKLIKLVGHGEAEATSSPLVGVFGYPGTGKRALCKAIRRTAQQKGSARWLMEAIGRLVPTEEVASATPASVLHLAVRGVLPKAAAQPSASSSSSKATPVQAVQHLLDRAGVQAVMRRFRLPAFNGTDGLLQAFAKDRSLKTKRGHVPPPEGIAQKLLTELAVTPGSLCVPFDPPEPESLQLWPPHESFRPHLEATIKAQLEVLQARPPGPMATALQMTSAKPSGGPKVDLEDAFQEFVDEKDLEEEDEDGEGWEGEEEEDFMDDDELEGEEEEDEDMDDD